MKILSCEFPNALYYIIKGWKDVFDRLGCEWVWWPPGKPAFDMFDEFEPDIFIGTTDIDRATAKCIADRPHMKVVLKGRNWGPSDEYIDTDAYPIEVANAEERGKILELKNSCGKPDLVFNLYHEKRMEERFIKFKPNLPKF